MALIEFWRDISVGSPNDTVDRYRWDTDTDTVIHDTFPVLSGGFGPIHPPAGTMLFEVCVGPDVKRYHGVGNNSGVDIIITEDWPGCCTLSASDFSVVKTNNTNLLTPNGTIKVTAPVLDIADYEASIDGSTWVTPVAGEILIEDLPAGNYTVLIRETSGVCNVSQGIVIADQITYPPLIVAPETEPALYSPVFHPITLGFLLTNNDAQVKEDMSGTYLEVSTSDGKEYLATLPIIKIFDNQDYGGTYQVLSVDDVDDPQKFYIDATFTTEQSVKFVPFDRQVFFLYAEVGFNDFRKIAEIAVYPNVTTGEYLLRVEGFLQSVFSIQVPVNNGYDLTLLRKYYVQPRDFDMEAAPLVYNAVYSAVKDLTPYLEDLVPLGPAPINFIENQRGLPILFSVIDTSVGRVRNITSSEQTEIVNNGTLVDIEALPFNSYDVTWINPAGAIADLQVSPALPAWITAEQGPSDTVNIHIDTNLAAEGGDYDGDDYDGDDYLTGGPNAIVGCYEFEFFDDETPLFTLRICVFPLQASNEVCNDPEQNFNIAWVNREGGWSSYLFEGKKVFGKDIGEVKTFKSGKVLKRSTVEQVYDTAEVTLANLSVKDLQFIASLRQSIQAYLYSPSTQGWTIPIILDRQSFPVYTMPFRQIDVNDKFTFKYAEEVVIQTQ